MNSRTIIKSFCQYSLIWFKRQKMQIQREWPLMLCIQLEHTWVWKYLSTKMNLYLSWINAGLTRTSQSGQQPKKLWNFWRSLNLKIRGRLMKVILMRIFRIKRLFRNRRRPCIGKLKIKRVEWTKAPSMTLTPALPSKQRKDQVLPPSEMSDPIL